MGRINFKKSLRAEERVEVSERKWVVKIFGEVEQVKDSDADVFAEERDAVKVA
jgi:hypothetical protein